MPFLKDSPAHIVKMIGFIAKFAFVSKGGANPFTLGAKSQVAVALFATTATDNTIVMLEAVSSGFIICHFRGGATEPIGATTQSIDRLIARKPHGRFFTSFFCLNQVDHLIQRHILVRVAEEVNLDVTVY